MFDRLTSFLALISALLFVAAGAMLSYEVVARYFFTKPTIWAAELSQLCLIWGSLLAMTWALRTRRHIVVDAVAARLPEGVRRITDMLAMLVVTALSAVVVWKGGEIFYDSFQRGRTTGSLLDLPAWVAELSVPVGFGFLLIQSLLEAPKGLRGEHGISEPGAHE